MDFTIHVRKDLLKMGLKHTPMSVVLRFKDDNSAFTLADPDSLENLYVVMLYIDSRDFIAAQKHREQKIFIPTGTKIALSGGLDYNDHNVVWNALDAAHGKYSDMVLIHGGSPKGAEHIASLWARNRGVTQIAFTPDWDKDHRAAPFKRNDRMLDQLPAGVMVFPGSGVQENFADKARKLGITVGVRKHGRRSGNYLKTVISIIFAWGKERGFCDDNPASGIKALKKPKGALYANRPWEDNERDAVLAVLPSHMRLPILLMMFCGLDPKDAVMFPKSAVKNGLMSTSRAKTGEPVWIPIPGPIAAAIEAEPANDTTMLCINSRGRPWTVSGFRASWRPIKLQLEKEGKIGERLTLKGLRHTVATILAEMGYDDRTIADMLGQRTIAMAQHYSRSANRSKKLAPVVVDLEREVNRRKTKNV